MKRKRRDSFELQNEVQKLSQQFNIKSKIKLEQESCILHRPYMKSILKTSGSDLF